MSEPLALTANGLRFHAIADGPADGPLVLLLHGFPELSVSWRHQLPALAAAGFRAVAPDLRGYGRTEKKGPYDWRTLSDDIAALVRALGREKAVIVGHDWGGAVAWGVAAFHPEVVERLVVLNCPHPAALAREIATNPRQLRKSLYMLFFQLPWLPERLLSRDHAGAIVRSLKGGSHVRGTWTKESLAPYREAFSDVSSAAAALAYYRSAFRHAWQIQRDARAHPIKARTLVLWGREDRFLSVESLRPDVMGELVAPGTIVSLEYVEGAGHFVQNEAPDEVNRKLVAWLGSAE